MHIILMVLLLVVDLLCMLLIDSRLSVSKLTSLLLLLIHEGLVACGIQQHALRVIVSACLHLLIVLISSEFQLLFKLVLDLILGSFKLLNLTSDLQLLGRKLFMKLLDLLLLVIC